ncbi:MAG: carotenoid biosynthesis protein [Bdellovibrionales bacterium]|nr:carotenoid biosynthesis protein [Bdellovibrionales bacterium]
MLKVGIDLELADYRILAYLFAAYIFFVWCWKESLVRSSLLKDKPPYWYTLELLSAVVFGVCLEWVGVHMLNYYHYGYSLVSILDIPLSTPLGWGAIIYSAMLTTDKLEAPSWTRPFLDAFFAIQIDLGMDVVATRLGLWTWTYYPEDVKWSMDWFGVPYGNYFGWIFTVLFFSLIFRLIRKREIRPKQWILKYLVVGVGVILCCEILLFGTLEIGRIFQVMGLSDKIVALWPWLLIAYPTFYGLKNIEKFRLSPLNIGISAFYHGFSLYVLVFTTLKHVNLTLIIINSMLFIGVLGFHLWLLKKEKNS